MKKKRHLENPSAKPLSIKIKLSLGVGWGNRKGEFWSQILTKSFVFKLYKV